jgi:hypothetical protein
MDVDDVPNKVRLLVSVSISVSLRLEAFTPLKERGLRLSLAGRSNSPTSGVVSSSGSTKRGVDTEGCGAVAGGAETVRRCDHRSRSCAIFFILRIEARMEVWIESA